MAWQRIRVDIPDDYGPLERKAIAQEIIDTIVERTLSGKDKDGEKFAGYSDAYKKSFEFRVSGKSKSNVNLRLSGEMLTALKLISDKKGSLLIGYDNKTEENSKAEGNRLGTYGQSRPIPGKSRDFLGIDNEINDILSKFPIDDAEKRRRQIETFKELAGQAQEVVAGLTLSKKNKTILGIDDG